MTHGDLVRVAERWLRNTKRCGVVLTEHVGGHEVPDAMGWKGGTSYLVECKVSRADFFADRRKTSRYQPQFRPAVHCWYLVPFGLVTADELLPGWGLLEYDGQRVRVRVDAPQTADDRESHLLRSEVYRLYCEVRRYQAQGLKYAPLKQLLTTKAVGDGRSGGPGERQQ